MGALQTPSSEVWLSRLGAAWGSRRWDLLRFGRLSLAGQYLLASLLVLVFSMVALGAWVAQQIETSVLNRTGAITALYVESIIEPYLQPLATQSRLDSQSVAALTQLLEGTSLGRGIVAFKVWSPEGEILFSPNPLLIGRRFDIDEDLGQALKGEVAANLSDLQDAENEYERQHWNRLVQVYVPVRERGTSRIIAVAEFYQLPDELEREVAAAQRRSWAVVIAGALLTYALLAGIVKRGSDTIATQQSALRQKVRELSLLLEQNARLHDRIRQAAGRTTALNEQALRRISADLHDGPGQALALALLRLDALEERSPPDTPTCQDLAVVRRAVRDALEEVRAISAGLRLPELASLSVAEVAERAVRDVEKRGGAAAELRLEDPPRQAPLPVKIALFRSLQEALSNATRHGGGVEVQARIWCAEGKLYLAVSDKGPGFEGQRVGAQGRLGLAGMKERAEVLGGCFEVTSRPGQGTTVQVCWPLAESEVPGE